jgi:5-methylcytosine-specific restriction endonuclease McrA
MICRDFLAAANLDNQDPETLLFSIARFFKFLPGEQRTGVSEPRHPEGFVNRVVTTRARQRLDPESYEQLRQFVRRRDGWRCQHCGAMSGLEVHHKEFRSQSGDDSEENLITPCTACHHETHRMRVKRQR